MSFFDGLLENLGSIGKVFDLGISMHEADKNREQQERFAKQGIRWRVADAKAAGLHPLAALGAAGASYSPSSVVSDLGGAGQDISRAIEATRDRKERDDARKVADLAAARQLALDERRVAATEAQSAAQVGLADAQRTYYLAQTSALNQPQNPPFPSARSTGPGGDHQLGGVQTYSPASGYPRSGLDKYTIDPAKVQSMSSQNPGNLAGPPGPATRTISLFGENWIIPNSDIDALLEEPLAAYAIISALNPGREETMMKAAVDTLWRMAKGTASGIAQKVGEPFTRWYGRGHRGASGSW